MSFTLNMLFELLPEYHFSVQDTSVLSGRYKAIHLLPVDSAELNPEMVYITDYYDMYRFGNFCKTQESGKHNCLIYIYEQDCQYAPGASVYLKDDQEMAIILNRMQEVITDIMLLERNLVDDVRRENSMDDILFSIHSMLNNPVAILSPALKLLAHCETVIPDDRLYQDIVRDGFLSEQWNRRMDNLQYFMAHITPKHPYVICGPDEFSDYYRIFYRISLFPTAEATLYCVMKRQVYEDSILSMLEMFVPHIQSRLIQIYGNSVSWKYEQFLTDLLSSPDITEQEIRARAYALDIPYEAPCFLLSTAPIREKEPVIYFMNQIKACFPSAYAVFWSQKAVILIWQETDPERIIEVLSPVFAEYNYKGGISHRFYSLFDTRLAFAQADAAQEISLKLEQSRFIREFELPVLKKSTQIYDYSSISVFHAYALACRQIDYKSFCSPELLQLLSYARKNNSSIIQVLYTYLVTGCSYVETAKKLHMHRNNVVYHIRRLKENEHFHLDNYLFREKIMMTFFLLFLQTPESI